MIRVEWLSEEDRILLHEYPTRWTGEEYIIGQRTVNDMIRSKAPDPVYTLIDMTQSETIPRDIVSKGLSITRNVEPNFAMCAFVGAPAMARNLFNVMAPFIPGIRERACFVKTRDEALQVLRAMMETTEPIITP